MELYITNNQDCTTTFNTSKGYTIWYSCFTNSTNTCFDFYAEYKLLNKGDDTKFIGLRALSKMKVIGKVNLDLEDNTGKTHNIILKKSTNFPGCPSSSSSLKNGPGTEVKTKSEGKGPISR